MSSTNKAVECGHSQICAYVLSRVSYLPPSGQIENINGLNFNQVIRILDLLGIAAKLAVCLAVWRKERNSLILISLFFPFFI